MIDSDRILVMSEGRAEEFDHPFKLLVKSTEDNEIRKNKTGTKSFILVIYEVNFPFSNDFNKPVSNCKGIGTVF